MNKSAVPPVFTTALASFISAHFPAAVQAEVGDLAADLVYTPVAPCRIFDTRPSQGGSGAISAGSFKDFFVFGDASTIGGQGGNAVSGCPAPSGEPSAVHINVTVVPGASSKGNLKVYPKGESTLASTVNFTTGVNLANAISVKTKFDVADSDISVEATKTVDVLADIQGYYYPAQTRWAYDGFDVFGSDYAVINSGTSRSVTSNPGQIPNLTLEQTTNIFYSATVTVKPESAGNVEVNLYACRFASGTTTPILEAWKSEDEELEACYTGMTTGDYITVTTSGIMNNVPAGTWEFSICADKSADVPCSSPVNYRTYIQQMSVIDLGSR